MITETSNDNKSVQERANFWITRLDKGLSSTEKQQLIAWINQDEAHYLALRRMYSLWGDITAQHELTGLFDANLNKKPHRDYFMKGSLAASIFAIAMLTVNLTSDLGKLWQTPQQTSNQHLAYQSFNTQFGQQKQITLTDGSKVTLNTNSIIEVAYSDQQRKVTLLRGEAKFDVAKDAQRPFTVIAGESAFTALGTIYNVQRNNSQDMELLVEEGKVLVSEVNTSRATLLKAITQAHIEPKSSMIKDDVVIAGEKLAIVEQELTTKQNLTQAEIEKELAWQQGMLIFNGEPLTKVLSEIERYNTIKFTPVAKNIADLKVSGYFKSNDINGLLQSLDRKSVV